MLALCTKALPFHVHTAYRDFPTQPQPQSMLFLSTLPSVNRSVYQSTESNTDYSDVMSDERDNLL